MENFKILRSQIAILDRRVNEGTCSHGSDWAKDSAYSWTKGYVEYTFG
jgi:hypothetical protein